MIGYLLTLALITILDLLIDIANLHHNAFTTANSNKTVLAPHMFDSLYALKSSNGA